MIIHIRSYIEIFFFFYNTVNGILRYVTQRKNDRKIYISKSLNHNITLNTPNPLRKVGVYLPKRVFSHRKMQIKHGVRQSNWIDVG